ncbi:unnamed protein product [Darwinula stevensoni]|uniref:Phosphoglycolate phosphatase n=1 Tax=Darwinula stevensoni TaxID=69355 RepID=A0A7R9A1T1_9CRUS|nr:unnamed protein product [Darwinula stevensoni]CAG0878559.1 unnamed protein product [Darwinula stevensoni]
MYTDSIYGTAPLIASYLKNHSFKGSVYIIGSSGISTELTAVGISSMGVGPDPIPSNEFLEQVAGLEFDPDVKAVVVGFDPYFDYAKLLRAASYLQSPDVLFIASNSDERFPMSTSPIVVPGTGSILASVKVASAREPIILGKPTTHIFEAIQHDHNIDPKRTLMIGDNVKTDILMGKNCGLATMLVLTGVTTEQELHDFENSSNPTEQYLVPDYYMPSIGDLMPLLQKSVNS